VSKWTLHFINTCHFCHIYCPHPHGNTVVSVPITTVLPMTLSPSRDITVTFIPITMVLLQIYRCPHPHAALYFAAKSIGTFAKSKDTEIWPRGTSRPGLEDYITTKDNAIWDDMHITRQMARQWIYLWTESSFCLWRLGSLCWLRCCNLTSTILLT